MSQGQYALARIPITNRPAGFYLRWWYTGWHYWQFLQGGLTLQSQGEKYRTRGTRILTVNSGPLTQSQVDGLRTILNSTEVYLFTDFGWVLVRLDAGSVKVYDNKRAGYELTLSVTIGSRLPSVTGYSPVTPLPPAPTPTYCETVIGTQIWLCKNWDAAYPASKVYDDNEANRDVYGGLYTYDQIMAAGFCPDGWHVATLEEWNTLIDFVGDNTDAGGILKAIGTDYWNSPNTGATDDYDFTAKGSGYMTPAGASAGIFSVYNVWTATLAAAGYAYFMQMTADGADIAALQVPTDYRLAVRFVKDGVAPVAPPTFGFVTSINGTFSMLVMGTGDIDIDWGDGSSIETVSLDSVYPGSLIEHAFTVGGTIRITGNYNSITRIYSPFNEISEAYIPVTMVLIEEIHLNNNNISSFITHKEWVLLRVFALNDNVLTEIDTFAEWVELSYFKINNNTGIALVETHIEWVDLRVLWVSGTNITSIDTFAEWVAFQYLYVYNNKLTSINTYAEWVELLQIRINDNLITSVDTYPEWVKLQYLFAENNLLTTIDLHPEWIKIDRIYLNGNLLTALTFQSAWVLLFYFYAGDALDVTTINDILAKVDALVWTGSSHRLYLDYGTNASPTGVGLTAKANLLSRGVDVKTN